MRGSATILGLILLVWMAGSVWWYTCKIKGNCAAFSGKSTQTEQLVIHLDGEDEQTFYLKNAGNGILQIVPGKKGSGIGMIRTWLDQHPGSSIDLVAQNEDQANGLLAMMIVSGVSNSRVNVYTDPSLKGSDRPLVIKTSGSSYQYVPEAETSTQDEEQSDNPDAAIADITFQNEETGDQSNVEEEKADPAVEEVVNTPEPKEIIEDEAVTETVKPEIIETTQQVKEVKTSPVVYTMPCPAVDASDGVLPEIDNIYYPTASSRVRCTSALNNFAASAVPQMESNPMLKLVVTGYTDNSQNQVNNYQLALKRAIEVKKYLIKKGVPGHRIETYSRGADNPSADNDTEEGRKLNRKVTISWN